MAATRGNSNLNLDKLLNDEVWTGCRFGSRSSPDDAQSTAGTPAANSCLYSQQHASHSRAGFPANATHATNLRTYELTQRKERKEHNEITSLLDKPVTAASDDGVCRWHAAKLWQTSAKLLKLNLICIINCTTSKNVLKFGLLFFFNF